MQTANASERVGMNKDDQAISLERYLGMNEKEKDTEIQNAIIRLQKRIQEILYLVETENVRMTMQTESRRQNKQSGSDTG